MHIGKKHKGSKMQYEIIAPRRIRATVDLPSSKSMSNRAIVIHALAGGDGSLLSRLSTCDDTDVMMRAMGSSAREVDIRAAGTAMRFLTAYFSVVRGERLLTGTERMKHRPIGVLVEALRYLGADISYVEREGFPPLRINGRALVGGRCEIAGNVSSQYTSALLMIAPMLRDGLELQITGGITSKPYLDLTLWMMREFGAEAEWSAVDTITVAPKPYTMRPYVIEGDWTAASYWYEMISLVGDEGSEVTLKGLSDGSMQGDSAVKYLFSLLGVRTAFASREPGTLTTVTLKKQQGRLHRLEYDFSAVPDLAQTAVATCSLLGIPFHFTGLSTLRIKETDRIEAMRREMAKLGYGIDTDGRSAISWDGRRSTPTGEAIDTHEDHRMAMSIAPAAILYPGLKINDPGVVTKSYPTFWDDLRAAGFTIRQL